MSGPVLSNRFKGQVALVTGGTAGIGEAASLAYANEGAQVVLVGRNSQRGHNVVSKIQNDGGTAEFIEADVSNSGEVDQFIKRTVSKFGRLDVAFNNAGVTGSGGMIHQYPEEEWNRTIDINLKGVWLCMKYQIQQMLNQKRLESSDSQGVIVNMASIAGHVASASPDYCASKHGVIGLTKSIAKEYGKKSINVNAVAPGLIDTEMTKDINKDNFSNNITLNRNGKPEDISNLVCFLCSEDASYITGQVINVDGGLII